MTFRSSYNRILVIPAWDVLVDLPVGNLVDDAIVLLWDPYIVGNLVYSYVKEDAALNSSGSRKQLGIYPDL